MEILQAMLHNYSENHSMDLGIGNYEKVNENKLDW